MLAPSFVLQLRGHKCPRLFYLEVSDYDEVTPPSDVLDTTTEEDPLISLHAIARIHTEDTMQVRVAVGNHEFTTLLDSGSTSNFISRSAAGRARLHFLDSTSTSVIVANGDRVACTGLARDVDIQIGREFFTIDCYTIPLECYDMVLGVHFLRTLGLIIWDFDDLCTVCSGKVLDPHARTFHQLVVSMQCARMSRTSLIASWPSTTTYLPSPSVSLHLGIVTTAFT